MLRWGLLEFGFVFGSVERGNAFCGELRWRKLYSVSGGSTVSPVLFA